MCPYKLKQLENVESYKKDIIENTWRKVRQPERKKRSNLFTVAFTSIASIALIVMLSWSFIVSPKNSQTEMPIEGVPLLENIESIEIWKMGVEDSVVITEESELQVLYEIITTVLQQSAQGQLQTEDFHYTLQMNERGYYPRGQIVVTNNQLAYLSMVASINDDQYKKIIELFDNQRIINNSFKSQPIGEEDGLYYFDLLTLADSKSAMIRHWGYEYTERQNEEGLYGADAIYNYGTIEVYMQDDMIVAIENQHINSEDFDAIYDEFSKRGYVEEKVEPLYVASFYNEETNQQITFENNSLGALTATLRYKTDN